jgi:hypothetical protein
MDAKFALALLIGSAAAEEFDGKICIKATI